MSKNLNDLNDILFDTLAKVKSGEMKVDQAQTVVNVGNTIINNAKVQIQAFKMTGGMTGLSILSENNNPNLILPERKLNDRSMAVLNFAKSKGYKNVAEAIAVMGKTKFNIGVDEYIKKELKIA
ncbi:hypothetical protein [Flagellimonas sp.]|uniref:hypothetical protein n=1 Tax=Flagellimonas sp. TaxID=2058762 RepID=UPI003BAD1331